MAIGFETPPQPGDFTGLVNLQELSIEVMEGETLPAGTIHGLDKLKTLTVSMGVSPHFFGTGCCRYPPKCGTRLLYLVSPCQSDARRISASGRPYQLLVAKTSITFSTIKLASWMVTPYSSAAFCIT